MGDPSLRQGPARGHSLEPVPAHASVLLASPPEAVEPDAPNFLPEPVEGAPVVRHAEVAVMAAQDAGIPAVLLGQRGMHQPPRLPAQRRQLARQALALRLVLDDEPAVPGPPAIMGEAEEGEGFRTPLATLLSRHGRKPAERDQPRLVLVQRQAELGQPLLEVDHHPPRIDRALEAHHEVVGIAHDRDPTASMSAAPLMDPEVEHVMQEDVGQERADAGSLRRSPVRLVPLIALQDAGFEPLADKPQDFEDRQSCAPASAAATRGQPS